MTDSGCHVDCEFVFGGTFDPVHLGHIEIIKTINQIAPNSGIRILPCAIPALKNKPQTTFEQRVAMLMLATEEFATAQIDKRESLREKTSYTIETLIELRAEFPSKTFVFVMGADSIASFKNWFRWQEIHQYCHLLVVSRADSHSYQLDQLVQQAGFDLTEKVTDLELQDHGLALVISMRDMPQASNQIRKAVTFGKALDSLLPNSVIEYISKNHLYESD